MESSANNNTLNEIPFMAAILKNPDRNTIAVVLEEELKRNYTEASVQWVTHPNLSYEPFNLAAPGICGDTALVDYGHESYLHKPLPELPKQDLNHILTLIGRHRRDTFIFGHGVFPRLSKCRLSEIVVNELFLPKPDGGIGGTSSSGFTVIQSNIMKCNKIMLPSKLEFAVQGTYFLSEGLRTDEPVLKVHAKGPYLDNEPFCGSKRFIYSMQHALEQKFGSENFVALGGVYTVNNVLWEHKTVRNWWEPRIKKKGICQVETPETMIATFTSSNEFHLRNSEHPIRLNSCQSYHSLSHHSCSEKYIYLYEPNKLEKYEGYFCPVKTLFRLDQPPQ